MELDLFTDFKKNFHRLKREALVVPFYEPTILSHFSNYEFELTRNLLLNCLVIIRV